MRRCARPRRWVPRRPDPAATDRVRRATAHHPAVARRASVGSGRSRQYAGPMSRDAGWLKEHIRDIHDFPKPGVVFKDITPLLADVDAFRFTIDAIADHFAGSEVHKVVGVEARGFIVAAPVAYRFGAGLVPVRKAGKLPHEIESEEYELEYGTDLLEIHRDAVQPGENVVI